MNNNVPVVQGYAINQPQGHTQISPTPLVEDYNDGGDNFNGYKGQPQPKKFNDVFFAILFYAHLVAMACALPLALQDGGGNGGGDIASMVYFVSVCGVFSTGVSTVSIGFMMKYASSLIKMALYFQIGVSLAMAIFMLMSGSVMGGLGCGFYFMITVCYTCSVQSRIPFAAANLTTALTAVRDNLGLTLIAYVFLFVALIFTIAWTSISNAVLATYPGMAFLLFLSYFWTHQVLSNTMHVTSAGVIGTWWFAPSEASAFCSQAIGESFGRATTYSFGSICFGSLVVALIQALRQLNHQMRGNEDAQILVCLIDCILACIEGIIEYFNKWAYVYVGLYGYSYIDAGRNVITLFRNKGWSTIISDDLAENVLFMISVMIGLLTGLVGFIVASLDQNIFANFGFEEPGSVGFIFGFLVGLVMSSILMSVVASSVKTVIVCFAESPAEFQQNHPQLSMQMREAWSLAYPEARF